MSISEFLLAFAVSRVLPVQGCSGETLRLWRRAVHPLDIRAWYTHTSFQLARSDSAPAELPTNFTPEIGNWPDQLPSSVSTGRVQLGMATSNLHDLPMSDVSKLLYQYEIGSFAVEDDLYPLSDEDQATLDRFHEMYFRLLEKKSGLQISWLGYQTGKVPADLWLYQEMIVELRPDVIIECGTHWGGSALFLASMCQIVGTGRVITIDLYSKPLRPNHNLIEYVDGSSIDPDVVAAVKKSVGEFTNVMVVLDSNHTANHVHQEIKAYKDFVPVGGYLVVEDTFLNGHPSHSDFGPGPMEAVDAFLSENDEFVIDSLREKLLFTLNRRGFLKRVK